MKICLCIAFIILLQGLRAPYLQTGGNSTYEALQSLGMLFDSSLPTKDHIDPPIWPYTLDYGDTQVIYNISHIFF